MNLTLKIVINRPKNEQYSASNPFFFNAVETLDNAGFRIKAMRVIDGLTAEVVAEFEKYDEGKLVEDREDAYFMAIDALEAANVDVKGEPQVMSFEADEAPEPTFAQRECAARDRIMGGFRPRF